MTPSSGGAAEALGVTPRFVPALKELAAAATTTGKLAEAARALEQAVALGPGDGNALADLGSVYLRQGRVDDAREGAAARARARPDAAAGEQHDGTGGVAKRRSSGLPKRHFREAIRLQPDLAEAHNNLGNLLAGRQAYAEAASSLRKGDRAAIRPMWKRATATGWCWP